MGFTRAFASSWTRKDVSAAVSLRNKDLKDTDFLKILDSGEASEFDRTANGIVSRLNCSK